MGWWDHLREAINTMRVALQTPPEDMRIRLATALWAAWEAERRLCIHVRQTIPEILYEQFRQRLEIMAHADEQHATLLRDHLRGIGVVLGDRLPIPDELVPHLASSPWRRVHHLLAEKRELYELYRQEANATDDPALRSLLEQLRADEEKHQEQLIEMLMQLDAYVHETIT